MEMVAAKVFTAGFGHKNHNKIANKTDAEKPKKIRAPSLFLVSSGRSVQDLLFVPVADPCVIYIPLIVLIF